MGSLDLTLESELTLFRNRYSAPEVATSSTTADVESPAQTPFVFPNETPHEEPYAHHDDDTILDVSNRTVDAADNLAMEAARLAEVSLDDLETDDLGTDDFDGVIDDAQDLDESFPDTTDVPMADDIPAGAIVPSNAFLSPDDALADSATLATYTDPSLDDYLASSEALLRHLDTPVSSDQFDNSVSLRWFAWAAGATLVLSLLAAFFLQNVFQTPRRADPDPAPSPTETPAPQSSSSSPGVNSPDLASNEFQEVKPGSLAELPTPESPAQPEPSATGTEPETTASATSPSETNGTGSQADRRFYVVAEYVDEASLDRVKAIAPEAAVVQFTGGTKIQLQQFTDEATARTAAAEFEQKGIEVEILATAAE